MRSSSTRRAAGRCSRITAICCSTTAAEQEIATKFAKKVKDISEFLIELGPVKPTHPLKMKAAYHDACHLCHGQQIRKPPRQLLEMIPELQLVPLNESEICCGAAGSYNLTQPEMAERLGERKAENMLATDADAVFTGNVGCLIQIGRYLRAKKPGVVIAHPIDALWASYGGAEVVRLCFLIGKVVRADHD